MAKTKTATLSKTKWKPLCVSTSRVGSGDDGSDLHEPKHPQDHQSPQGPQRWQDDHHQIEEMVSDKVPAAGNQIEADQVFDGEECPNRDIDGGKGLIEVPRGMMRTGSQRTEITVIGMSVARTLGVKHRSARLRENTQEVRTMSEPPAPG
jgi:hypothetical protein